MYPSVVYAPSVCHVCVNMSRFRPYVVFPSEMIVLSGLLSPVGLVTMSVVCPVCPPSCQLPLRLRPPVGASVIHASVSLFAIRIWLLTLSFLRSHSLIHVRRCVEQTTSQRTDLVRQSSTKQNSSQKRYKREWQILSWIQ